ncbi:MarR family transcriptional regulator [Amycolatopsis acidiphila]|uniref:MarR family transcriptional regulator n=1 Tax=Amycolatopsis acidiphila TaxID=715473 RepID=A0A558A3E7_9PSEU|nr:MarR family transcriptional regulator [Amycolatopsis acidiphila]TVT18758.1 MarR family transcriptional regulator [Amycolatopsis acidiphila]UIJ56947.1 MarR family transcriptional regulator [Amycolatopsis acidiphila]GHG54176.1 MarR family transcriptional regulator [Amycolatopsis acidiphila]
MAGPERRDRVDVLMEQITTRTEDEFTAKSLSFRLRRVAHRLETELRRELSAFGIELWELELLGALKRAGPPYRLSAGALLDTMRVTSGGVTKRVAGLERKGWVRRDVDPRDRRQILVSLTETGLRRAREVFDTKTDTETKLLSGLAPAAQRRLNEDLRRLLVHFEGGADD